MTTEIDAEGLDPVMVEYERRMAIYKGYSAMPEPTEQEIVDGAHILSEIIDDAAPLNERRYRFPAAAMLKFAAYLSASRSTSEAEPVVQCCMCGKTGLSTVEGDGGPECQLSDGRWTSSQDCWEHAVDPTPTSDDQVEAAIETALRAAYARGYEWRGENPSAESNLPKAAADYADKVMHDREGTLFNAIAAMGSTKT